MKKLLLISSMLFFGFKAFAGNYGAAGCGLGSLLFEGKNEWYEQTLAATTNASFGTQTFGITFGSLNCDANKLASNKDRAKIFVTANKNAVVNELAMGQGETVSVLANIYNCNSSKEFANTMKANYNKVISSEKLSSEQIVENIGNVLNEAQICEANLG